MPRKLTPCLCLCVLLAAVLSGTAAQAQSEIPHRYVELNVDSGDVRNRTAEPAVTFSETIEIEGAAWLRLYFADVVLGRSPAKQDATVLRITSLEDGAVQVHTAESLAQWRHSSAFFNGDEVRVELFADPEAEPSRLRIHEVMVGEPAAPQESICGAMDDRVLSSDPRAARIVPVGCTAWLINDAEGCFLTAGHCTGDSFDVVEFNVPLSDPNGSVNHPAPQHQYAIDLSSLQWDQTVIGNDWGYFGAFPNVQTQLTPFEAQGASYVLGTPPATPGGETIVITGYGSVDGTQGTPQSWSQVQTTHSGPLVNVSGTVLQYQTDTTGGNSGSAVFNQDDSTAIGIHTNAGCSAGGGANQGTSLANAGVQNALANPIGICTNGAPPLRINLVSPLPDTLPLAGGSFQVEVVDRDGAPAAINSATLVYDAGGGDQTAALTPLGGSLYEATLPAMSCGDEVTFRVDVEATNGSTVRHPFSAQNSVDRRYHRRVAAGHDVAFIDSFETNKGWTVDSDGSLTAGAWQRGLPAGYGMREDPPWDADGSGQAFLTDPAGGNTDVDGGATRLTSPSMDATQGADPHVTYWRWWADAGSSDDTFLVELSNDDGGSWTTLETVGPNVTGQWVFQSFRVADFLTPTDQMRLRFTAGDLATGNVIEAAVDGVALRDTATGLFCTDIFSDGFESGNLSSWSSSVGGP